MTVKGTKMLQPLRWVAPLVMSSAPLWVVVSCCGAAPPESAVAPLTDPASPAELASLASPMVSVPDPPPSASGHAATPAGSHDHSMHAHMAPSVTVAPGPVTSSSTAPVAIAPNAARFVLSGTVSNSAGKPLSGAVVYLEDGPKEAGRGEKAAINQKDMLFLPFINAIGVGGSVTFSNSDPFPHNVFSTDGEKFNLGMVSQSASRTRQFKQVGAYRILCNLHPGMLAYVVVVPSSFFGISDGKGNFKIKDVPEGTYKVAAWGRDVAVETQSVTIKGADNTSVAFTLKK